MQHLRLKFLPAAGALISLLLGACATSQPRAAPPEQRAAADPWEPLNRQVYAFNDAVDKVTLKPAAKAYEKVLPQRLRRGIHNFSSNLASPLNIVNNLLQGKFKGALGETGRFLANSTWGLLGFVDVGSDLGLASQPEDFGQTLAVWGVPDGPYVVLPIFGPRTLRDSFTLPLDYLADPVTYMEHDRTRYTTRAILLVDFRASLFAAESLIEDSFDKYLSLRESYLQNRNYLIHDGNPPEDDSFYEDFYDDPEEDQAPR